MFASTSANHVPVYVIPCSLRAPAAPGPTSKQPQMVKVASVRRRHGERETRRLCISALRLVCRAHVLSPGRSAAARTALSFAPVLEDKRKISRGPHASKRSNRGSATRSSPSKCSNLRRRREEAGQTDDYATAHLTAARDEVL